MQTDTTPNEVVKEFFIAGYLDHDYDRVMELVAEDYVDRIMWTIVRLARAATRMR